MTNKLYLRIFSLLLIAFVIASCGTAKQSPKEDTKPDLHEYFLSNGVIDTANIADKAKNFVIQGSLYQMSNRHAEAIIEFQQASRMDSSAAIFYAIAKSYLELSKLEMALENLNLALKQDPEFLPAWELLIQAQIMNYDLPAAIKTTENILLMEDTRSRRITLARLYEFEDLDKAIDMYENLLKEEVDMTIARRLTYLYKQNHQDEEFINGLEKLYEFDNQDNETILTMIDYYGNNKDYASIGNLINKIDKTLPINDLSRMYYYITGFYDDNPADSVNYYIAQYLPKIDERFKNDVDLSCQTGQLHLRLKDLENGTKYMKNCLAMADTNYSLIRWVFYSYFINKYYQNSADITIKYIPQYPDSVGLYLDASRAYFSMEKNEKALDILIKAEPTFPENIELLNQMAFLYDKAGDSLKVLETYEKVWQIDTSDPMANNNYAYYLAIYGGDLQKAVKMANLAISADPESPFYLDTYGWVLYKLGDYDKALEYIQRAVQIRQLVESYDHLGDIYIKLNSPQQAKQMWEKALLLEPENEAVQEKLKENNNK